MEHPYIYVIIQRFLKTFWNKNIYEDDIVIIIACGGSCMTYEDLVKASSTLNVS